MSNPVWKVMPEEEAVLGWDPLVRRFPFNSLGQARAWGSHKAEFGWTPIRISASRNAEPVFAAQALYKPLRWGAGLLWIPGGPLGDFSLLSEFLDQLRKIVPARMLYIRVRPHSIASDETKNFLRTHRFRLSREPLSTDQTMWLRLDRAEDELLSGMSSSWRHNLKRSGKYGLKITRWENPDPAEMHRLYQAMQSYKDLDEQFSLEQLTALFRHFGNQIVLFRCDSAEGELLAFRGCAIQGDAGWDLFAAASPTARKVYASYALLWSLLREANALGVKNYDLMGVDPLNNPGVYNFKQGVGSEPIRLTGEWEWAKPALLGPLANWMIRRTGARL